MTPLWRWWLFCAALWLSWHTGCGWASRLFSWSVLPEWVASPEEIAACAVPQGDSPF